MNIRDWLCAFLNCADCTDEQEALLQCWRDKEKLELALEQAQEKIRQFELLVPRPPPPKLDYIVEKSDAWVEAQLNGMGLHIVRLRLDTTFKVTNRKNFVNKIVPYDLTDELPYIRSVFDCEDFTFKFKINMHLDFDVQQMAVILDYKSGHSYGLVLFDDSEHLILEVQNDGLYLWTQRPTEFYSLEGAIALI